MSRFKILLIVCGMAALAVGVAVVVVSARRQFAVVPPIPTAPSARQPGPFQVPLRELPAGASVLQPPGDSVVEKFCSTCHVLPPADVEPRAAWAGKIQQMYSYAEGQRPWPKTEIPAIEAAIDYWTVRAPVALTLPVDAAGTAPSPLLFQRRAVEFAAVPSPPAVSCVRFVRLADDSPTQLLVSDMRHGVVVLWTPSQPPATARILARIPHPSRTCVVDLDGDGIRDILVANLGVFWPLDTDQGSVIWLRGRGREQFDPVVLLDKVGRVNEVSAADFDADGDLDLAVAVFGNFITGMIVYLENFTEDYDHPDFEPISLDGHTGTSDIPVVDLNGDGRPDLVALQSQEHERVLAFLNARRGRFNPLPIYSAPHTRWGSTGIKLADLDADGDVDILYNNGDQVQLPPVLRPYHGVSWLENTGGLQFQHHQLAHLPGAHTSHPVDLDGDGDLDVVSSVFIPAFLPGEPDAAQLDTIVWLSQTAPRQFQRFGVEKGYPRHPCLDVGDVDGDGDLDLVVGNFVVWEQSELSPTPSLFVLENQSRR